VSGGSVVATAGQDLVARALPIGMQDDLLGNKDVKRLRSMGPKPLNPWAEPAPRAVLGLINLLSGFKGLVAVAAPSRRHKDCDIMMQGLSMRGESGESPARFESVRRAGLLMGMAMGMAMGNACWTESRGRD